MTAAALPIRVFEPRESYRYARQAAFGTDSAYLAQATRPRALSWRHEKTLVVGALADDGTPACWAAFGPLGFDRAFWQYGNLFTKPEHRRRGLAQAVVSQGLAVARAAGAHRVFCLIADDNEASASFHEQLGFAPTTIRMSKLSSLARRPGGARDAPGYSLDLRELENRIVRELPLCGLAARDATLSFVLSHLMPDQPLLPWRRPATRAACVPMQSGAPLYVRCSTDSINAFAGWKQGSALDSTARTAELMAALQSLARPNCAVFHDEQLAQTLAPHTSQRFTVSAVAIR
jgi:Sortase and related acyltransferases